MKNIIIVGAGGLANDLYMYLQSKLNQSLIVKGILVDNIEDYNKSGLKERYLGKIKDYQIKKKDLFLIAIGKNPGRKMILQYLTGKGASFFTLVHPTVILHPSAIIKEGSIIGPYSIIGSNSVIENNSFINKYCNIGHNAILKEGCILYPYSMVGGESIIGKNVVLSTRTTVSPKLHIGDNCVISAHSFVNKNVNDNTFVFNSIKQVRKKV
jgi:sugar O-acyltransferase (sialic acid O-acetyltransferase NeuD family)